VHKSAGEKAGAKKPVYHKQATPPAKSYWSAPTQKKKKPKRKPGLGKKEGEDMKEGRGRKSSEKGQRSILVGMG